MTTSPKISMAVASDGDYGVVKRTISYLLKQTVLPEIELIIACDSADELNPDMADLEQFGFYQIVERPGSVASGQFIETAVNAARAPAFMYLEEHNFPPPRTAEVAIKELVENERPALGFGMAPSNPGVVAWSHIYGQFGPAVAPLKSGPAFRFGGHHAAYRRDLLLGFGDAMGDMMNNEAVMHEHLRSQGTAMHLTSEVVIPHAQISDFATLVRQDYLAQRVFADARMKVMDWSLGRRLLYVAGSPLIPLKRGVFCAYHIVRTKRFGLLLPCVPVMFAAHCAGAYGEALGYLFGAGEDVQSGRMEIELDRYAFVNRTDQQEAREGHFVRTDEA